MNGDDKKPNGDASQEASLYPYTSLAPSMKISEAVSELGGSRSEVSKSRLAAFFKESEKSASFLQRVSSAKAFGLIVGRSDYLLSEASKRYYYPTDEQDKSNALLDFLATPASFREIIRLFDGGQLPKREMLGNIFGEKFKVPVSWKDRAAAFFENSAQFVGVIDENRFLRFKAARHKNDATGTVKPEAVSQSISQNNAHDVGPQEASAPEGYHPYHLPLPNNRKVTVIAPLDITPQEIKRLVKWAEFTLQINWSGEENKTP